MTQSYDAYIDEEARRRLAEERLSAGRFRPGLGRIGIGPAGGRVAAEDVEVIDINERVRDYRPRAELVRAAMQGQGGGVMSDAGMAGGFQDAVRREGLEGATAFRYHDAGLDAAIRDAGLELPAELGLDFEAKRRLYDDWRESEVRRAVARELQEQMRSVMEILPEGSTYAFDVPYELGGGKVSARAGAMGLGGAGGAADLIGQHQELNQMVEDKFGAGWYWDGKKPAFNGSLARIRLDAISGGLSRTVGVRARKEMLEREQKALAPTLETLELAWKGHEGGAAAGMTAAERMKARAAATAYPDKEALKRELDEYRVRAAQINDFLDGLGFQDADLATMDPDVMKDVWFGLTHPAARAAVSDARARKMSNWRIYKDVVKPWQDFERRAREKETMGAMENPGLLDAPAAGALMRPAAVPGPGGGGGGPVATDDMTTAGTLRHESSGPVTLDAAPEALITDEATARARLKSAHLSDGEIEATIRSMKGKGLIR